MALYKQGFKAVKPKRKPPGLKAKKPMKSMKKMSYGKGKK